jgi:hypothetical protein
MLCDPRVVRRFLPTLLAAGKLSVDGGLLVNNRLMREIVAYELRAISGKSPANLRRNAAKKPNDFYARARRQKIEERKSAGARAPEGAAPAVEEKRPISAERFQELRDILANIPNVTDSKH